MGRSMAILAITVTAAIGLAACGATPRPVATESVVASPSQRSQASPTARSVSESATPESTPVAGCVRHGEKAFPGVVDVRPDGWSDLDSVPTDDPTITG